MKPKLFIVMPIGGMADSQRKLETITTVAHSSGWSVVRPDYDPDDPRFNLDETLDDIRSSRLVLVDLSGERPSCYYELGLAEAVGANVKAIAQTETVLHQSSVRGSVKHYNDLGQLEILVKSILGECNQGN